MSGDNCVICRGAAGDAALRRVEVWQDELWRLNVSLDSEVSGFAYLEPKRHIPHITDLKGPEAHSFGDVLSNAATELRDATAAEVVYLYIFGTDVPHLHVHLAPHRAGDALSNRMIKGGVAAEPLPGGAKRYVSKDYPTLPEDELRAVAERVRVRLTGR